MGSLNHYMIDIETYDTKPSAVILSIGACRVMDPSVKFYVEIDVATQTMRTTSQSTKNWWEQQGNPPIHGTTSLYGALESLDRFLQESTNPIIWCKGTDFDTAILAHAYADLYLPTPWKYNNVRDCRTVFKIADITPKKANHFAIDDAVEQSEDLLVALNKLGAKLA